MFTILAIKIHAQLPIGFCSHSVPHSRSREYSIDHRYKFNETDEDRRLRDKIMDLHPSIPVLLTDAEFVTFPNPSLSIRLPGEFVVRGRSSRVSEEVLLPALPSRESR